MTANKLKLKRIGIDTNQENVAFINYNSSICKSEGFEALARIKLSHKNKEIIATLNIVYSNIIKKNEIGLSEKAIILLNAPDGDLIEISNLKPIKSLAYIRAKIFEKKLTRAQIKEIINDIISGNYSNVHLAAFISSMTGKRVSLAETIYLTQAMIDSGHKINWGKKSIICDKHSIGGIPGNRTTPIVVAIIAACGLKMPKTSSRAITSPSGTADTMEVITNVNLSAESIKEVVKKEGGCFVWGGTADLSPADDIIIRVERALDIDSDAQMVASVLSKKKSAGATHLVIDIPYGKTAKVRDLKSANMLKNIFEKVAKSIGIKTKVLLTEGKQPIGKGIGPVLEMLDIISVLKNEKSSPIDLKEKSIMLAGEILELANFCKEGQGKKVAEDSIKTGKAFKKFKQICLAQGSFKNFRLSKICHKIYAKKSGKISAINNRKIAKVAKYAGAPENKKAGVLLNKKVGDKVRKRDLLFTIFAESKGELEYSLEFINQEKDIIMIQA